MVPNSALVGSGAGLKWIRPAFTPARAASPGSRRQAKTTAAPHAPTLPAPSRPHPFAAAVPGKRLHLMTAHNTLKTWCGARGPCAVPPGPDALALPLPQTMHARPCPLAM